MSGLSTVALSIAYTMIFLVIAAGYYIGKFVNLTDKSEQTAVFESAWWHGIGYFFVTLAAREENDLVTYLLHISSLAIIIIIIIVIQMIFTLGINLEDTPPLLQIFILVLLSLITAYEIGSYRQQLRNIAATIKNDLSRPDSITGRKIKILIPPSIVYLIFSISLLVGILLDIGEDRGDITWIVILSLIIPIFFVIEYITTWYYQKDSFD